MFAIIALSLLSAFAYSTDVILGKIALDAMSMRVFTVLLSGLYSVVGMAVWAWDAWIVQDGMVTSYILDERHRKIISVALAAVLIGSIAADLLAWWSYALCPHELLHMASILLSTSPLWSLGLLVIFMKAHITPLAIAGIFVTTTGIAMVVAGS